MPAITPLGNFDYIMKEDQGEDADPYFVTTFHCRKMSSTELSKANDLLNRQELHNYIRHVLTYGLRGWTNYKTSEGVAVAFETSNLKHPSSKTLDLITYSHALELVGEIIERSQSRNEDKGK